jgi:hypothetical protein
MDDPVFAQVGGHALGQVFAAFFHSTAAAIQAGMNNAAIIEWNT